MEYIHVVQYYETDKMGVTHHSNYIRWMEEARIAFLSQIGWEFSKLEEMGIISPIISVSCDYKRSTTFSDEVHITVSVKEFKGVKLQIAYEMTNRNGEQVCTGTTVNAFLNTEGKPVRMKQEYPELFNLFKSMVDGE